MGPGTIFYDEPSYLPVTGAYSPDEGIPGAWRFCMKLTVKILDIAVRRGILLNRLDARSIGVLDGDRYRSSARKMGLPSPLLWLRLPLLKGREVSAFSGVRTAAEPCQR